eukprot:394719_1
MGNSGTKKKSKSATKKVLKKEEKQSDTKDNKDQSNKKEDKNVSVTGNVDLSKVKEYTMEEIAKHDKKENGIWLIINGLVYDVTEFMGKHPGGSFCLLGSAGDDATEEFSRAEHPNGVMEQANKDWLIGKLKKQ